MIFGKLEEDFRLANALGGKYKIDQSKMALKTMENISNFLDFYESLGVPKTDAFQTVDLYEGQNITEVINDLLALARKTSILGKSEPQYGPKEATSQPRQFPIDQHNEGKNVFGLQMGSNKGASQYGDHFGKSRQVEGANVYK